VALFTIWSLSHDVAAGIDAGVDFVFSKDLVAQPPQWQSRLEEILSAADGRMHPRSLACSSEPTPPKAPPMDWRVLLPRALSHASLRWLGPEVLQALLRRVLRLAFDDYAEMNSSDWVLPNALALQSTRCPRELPRGVSALWQSLADQVQRLLGAEASAPFRTFLSSAIP